MLSAGKLMILPSFCWLALSVAELPHPTDPFSVQSWSFWQSKIASIVSNEKVDVRNLQITQTYSEVGMLFQRLIKSCDSERCQANWPTVAVWASYTVGQGIRETVLVDLVKEVAQQFQWPKWFTEIPETIAEIASKIARPILNAVVPPLGHGNKVVFDEVGGAFAQFGVHFANLSKPDDARLSRYMNSFYANQSNLSKAMNMYYRSIWEPQNRSQLIFYANALVGLHEQMRLQDDLVKAFLANVTVDVFGHAVRIFPDLAPLATQVIMRMVLPNETLPTDGDVPPRPWDGEVWPMDLQRIVMGEARSLYLWAVPSEESLAGTAARDWTYLDQRMRWVWPMFRSRQDSPLNNCPPFSPSVVQSLWANELPVEDKICIPYTLACCSAYVSMQSDAPTELLV